MGCLNSTQVAAIKEEIVKLDAQILTAETAYTASLTNSEIQEYRFNSGDGNQMAIRRAPKQIREEIDALQSKKARLQRRLDGTSNVNLNLRRRRGTHAFLR